MKKWLVALIIGALFCLAVCVAQADTSTTVMMYMCGTDLKDDCLTDMAEIAAASYGDEVTVAVLAGGTKNWGDSRLKNNALNLYEIKNGHFSAVTDWGRASMGASDTLVKYVNECMRRHPADRYVLILWDHGGGSAFGVCFDEIFNDDALTLQDLQNAFAQLRASHSDFHLDILGADACLMGSYELACVAAPYADYLVASEELEPYLGWYYTNWLNDLGSTPSMSTENLARAIVDSYKYGCERDDPRDYLTLSAIDLSVISDLSVEIDKICSSLMTDLSSRVSVLSRSFRSCYIFGNYDNAGSDMIDMTDFLTACEAYNSTAVQNARQLLSRAVVYEYANSYVPDAEGLSIFIPMENASQVNSVLSGYSASEGYVRFIQAYGNAVNGSSSCFTAGNTVPEYMDDDEMCSTGFLSSAFSFSYCDDWSDWEWNDDDWCYYDDDWGMVEWGFGGNYGTGYGNGSGFGYNGNGFVIAGVGSGTTGTTGNTGGSGAVIAGVGTTVGTTTNGVNVVIAGTGSVPSVQPTAVPSQSTGETVIAGMSGPENTQTPGGVVIAGIPGPETTEAPVDGSTTGLVIAGITPVTPATADVTVPEAVRGSMGFSINVDAGELQELAWAECVLMVDGAGDGTQGYLQMGSVRDTWVDWFNGKVYSLFDGTWPAINDVNVVLYDQAVNALYRRCLVPVRLNGTETYLVVQFTNGDKYNGTILGSSAGWNDAGIPVRGITPLNTGDVFTPLYTLRNGADAGYTTETFWRDEPEYQFTWDGSQTVQYIPVSADEGYAISFSLHDVYGGITETEMMHFTIDR